MKRTKPNGQPLRDYGLALKTAVSWLGDRYLLAQPVARLKDDRRPFFVETQRWLSRKH